MIQNSPLINWYDTLEKYIEGKIRKNKNVNKII